MIQRLHIKGFQSLADVDLPLGQFTVIQGQSNSGKSAVIRALRAVVTNAGNLRGTGGSFIHKGSKACEVTVEREAGTLTWRKTQSSTKYKLSGASYGDKGKEFTTGQDVPDEVAEFLKMGDITIDDANSKTVNVNIQGGARGQGQFEPPFLVVDRPGSFLAKVFALLTSANVLYDAQAIAKKEGRQSAGKLKTVKELHDAEQQRLSALRSEYAPIHAASETATRLLTEYQAAIVERDRLVAIQTNLARVEAELADVEAQLTHANVDLAGPLALLDSQLAQLASYQAWSQAVTTVDAELAALEAQGLTELPASVTADLARLDELVAQEASYTSWIQALLTAEQQLAEVDRQLEANAQERDVAVHALHEVVADIDYCPTCDQKLEVQVMTA